MELIFVDDEDTVVLDAFDEEDLRRRTRWSGGLGGGANLGPRRPTTYAEDDLLELVELTVVEYALELLAEDEDACEEDLGRVEVSRA